MGQKEGPLTSTKIESENKHKLESESNIGSALFSYQSLPSISPPPLPLLPSTPLPPYTMSQHNLELQIVIWQQQKQLAILQV